MGRQNCNIRVNPKMFGGLSKPCTSQMVAFLNCLALHNNSDDKCVKHKELMDTCINAQGKNKINWGSINYHLARLSRGR